jgi:hypothetical protein
LESINHFGVTLLVMGIGTTRALNADLARLETAAALAGCALVCTHQSAEEFHSALIREYLSVHGRRQATFFVVTLGILAAVFIWF